MVRKFLRDFRYPLLWLLGCLSLVTLFIIVVSSAFHVDIAPAYMAPYDYEDTEGDSYDEEASDNMERLLAFRTRNISRLFYNRVPKCGSETVRFLLLRLAWFNDFEWITSKVYLNYTISTEAQSAFVEDFLSIKPPAIYERHLHFINFKRFNAEPPLYTNLVRDPVDRLVSWYYFIRFQEGHIRPMPTWRRNMTYDECVRGEFAECVSEFSYFRIIPFFCGQSYECRTQSDISLARAKRHLDEHYIAVGLAEDIRNYFVVMEYLLPSYFKDSVNMYDIMADELQEATKTKKKRSISTDTRNIMRAKLKQEYEFYYFAKQRFYRLLYLIEREKSKNLFT